MSLPSWRAIRRFTAIGAGDRQLVVRAFLHLVVADVALRTIGFRRAMARLEGAQAGDVAVDIVGPRTITDDDVRRARAYGRLIDAAARHHFVRAQCLQRSLVLHYWLRRHALPSVLRIGVQRQKDRLQAHAWVELGGFVVNDTRRAVAAFRPLRRATEGSLDDLAERLAGGERGGQVGPPPAQTYVWSSQWR